MSLRRVGILGGMGPEATILLMQKIVDAVDAKDDADHVPLIVDQNSQVPSRIAHLLEGGDANPGPCLSAMAVRLEAAGAEAIAMPCNTAHHYAEAICSAVSVPFLNMIDLSVQRVVKLQRSRGVVGVLASPAVRKLGLLDAALSRIGMEAIYADDEVALLATIKRIKSAGVTMTSREVISTASQQLLKRGAMVQLIACSEFSLLADSCASDVLAVDTLDCLVEAIVDFSIGRDHS
ncbi:MULTISPECIES: amino acid racemase [unclassified Mesorhizobium]|uniref:aspartate/glutamate racemase family protein n=2 Tax=Mesorhizobium TaxID=68287 RepID=UPI00247A5891|nr:MULTISPECIES: amino acid racemase [unclassified Mesorhizobium]